MFNNALEVVQTACRKELGKEFQFEFDERINPVLHENGVSAIEQSVLGIFRHSWRFV